MHVTTTDLEGWTADVVELTCGSDRRVCVNGVVVDALRVLDSRVALVVDHRWRCVSAAEYSAVLRSVGNAHTKAEAGDGTSV
jgi:hypothetical protein